MQNTKKGFTLIELLIVIGILAILVAAVVVVLNPAQLLAQARDGQRMSDMDSLRSAINLYLATAASPSLTTTSTMTSGSSSTFATAAGAGDTVDIALFGASTLTSSSTVVTGSGWIPVNFTQITGGSPLARLPIDPINDGAHFYAYTASSTSATYKLMTVLESSKYVTNMANDGGNSATLYEIGSNVTGL